MTPRFAERSGEDPRARLLRTLARQGITDERVLEAIAEVPRDQFVPEQMRDEAWLNIALPIGAGQTISQPYVVAAMTQAIRLGGDERVLEIGTGSGYQAAVLARLVQTVYSVERIPELAERARGVLESIGVDNVTIRVGDGSLGWPEAAPFDAVIVTAAAPRPPDHLIQQMSPEGGRLVIPVGSHEEQELLLIQRWQNETATQRLSPVRFVPLIGSEGWPAS